MTGSTFVPNLEDRYLVTWLTITEHLCHKWQRICSTRRNTFRSFFHAWLITGFVTKVTPQVPIVEHELPTLPEHMNSSPVFSEVRVTRSLVVCVMFCSSLSFFFGNCVFCPAIYEFRLSLWYLQTLLIC